MQENQTGKRIAYEMMRVQQEIAQHLARCDQGRQFITSPEHDRKIGGIGLQDTDHWLQEDQTVKRPVRTCCRHALPC